MLKTNAISLFRTGMTAMLDAIASTGSKAIVATLEDKTKSPEYLAIKCIEDEGPETFWKAAFGSILAKLKNNFAPFIPEQFVNIPGDLLGAFVHWDSANHQSLNKVISQAARKKKESLTLLDKFFDKCIKAPTDSTLKFIGLNRKEEKLGLFRFGIANVLAFIFGIFALKGSDDENLPGINISPDDDKTSTILKTIGYLTVEQITHVLSQWRRYYKAYEDEFGKNFPAAKALANVIYEKTFPGNFISAIGACLSTLWLGKKISKSAAGALGEIIPKALTRLLEVRFRRTTKDAYDENSPNKRSPNYKFHYVKWFNNLLDIVDYPFAKLRKLTIDHVVAPLFRPNHMTLNEFKNELYNSFYLPLEILKAKGELIENGNNFAEQEKSKSLPRLMPLRV